MSTIMRQKDINFPKYILELLEFDYGILFKKSDEVTSPKRDEVLYGNVLGLIGEIYFDKFIMNQKESNKNQYQQIFKCHNIYNYPLIVKRRVFKFTEKIPSNPVTNLDILNFICQSLHEYLIYQIASSYSTGVKAYDLQFTVLRRVNKIISELVMDDGGTTLSDNIREYQSNPKAAIKLLIQASKILCFLKKFNIAHNDLKPENFTIGRNKFLKLIDFDVSCIRINDKDNTMSNNRKDNGKIRGFTEGYAAPELSAIMKNDYSKQGANIEDIDAWKAEVYSFGILALALVGAINEDDFKTLKSIKYNETQYYIQEILNRDGLKFFTESHLLNEKFLK